MHVFLLYKQSRHSFFNYNYIQNQRQCDNLFDTSQTNQGFQTISQKDRRLIDVCLEVDDVAPRPPYISVQRNQNFLCAEDSCYIDYRQSNITELDFPWFNYYYYY